MKTVRESAYDPNVKVPQLGSPLDGMPQIGHRPTTSTLPEPKSSPVPSVRTPGRRSTTRYPFELYQDQVDTLKSLSLEEKAMGEKGSMSQMVRDALDDYLAKRKK
jgi:hypothetical protein